MFNKIIDYFKSQAWDYAPVGNETSAILGIKGENGEFECLAEVNEENKKFIFFSIFSENIPLGKRLEMSELLTRLNFGKFLGNFEMDIDDGELRYKTSIYFGNLELTPEIVENMIMTNIATMDQSIGGFIQLIHGGKSAIEACQFIEKNIST